MGTSIYTIGHSNTSLDYFLSLLKTHNIEVLVDTRSYPASRYVPHFGRRSLEYALSEVGIEYRYLGDKLGGRPRDRQFYTPEGKVDYGWIEASAAYQEGIEELIEASKGGSRTAPTRICILCTEEDPLRCHRRNLIARTLAKQGVNVQHIRGDGRIESEDKVREREAQPKQSRSMQARLL